nr:MAG TPA_asm: hypothetical protein [Caudoviricetes sp.]
MSCPICPIQDIEHNIIVLLCPIRAIIGQNGVFPLWQCGLSSCKEIF